MKTKISTIMVRFAMLECMAKDVLEQFKLFFQTIAQQEELAKRIEEHAAKNTPGLDVYRLGRTNAVGVKVADGGNLRFGKDGQKLICPGLLVAELAKFGYRLTRAEVLKNEGDLTEKGQQKVALRLFWSMSGDKIVLTPEQQAVARKYFDAAYYRMWGYFNPTSFDSEGANVTFNFSGVMQPNQANGLKDEIRDLRMIDENHFRCLRRTDKSANVQTEEWRPGDDTTEAVVKAAFDTRQARTVCPSRPSSHGAQR